MCRLIRGKADMTVSLLAQKNLIQDRQIWSRRSSRQRMTRRDVSLSIGRRYESLSIKPKVIEAGKRTKVGLEHRGLIKYLVIRR